MKLELISAGLEPGACGVGDYARELADELRILGVDVRLIALSDPHLQEEMTATHDLLRVSSRIPWNRRVEILKNFRNGWTPEWVSLQFVAYAWNRRGILFGTGKEFLKIAPQASWQVTFHELWIGQMHGATWRPRLIGMIQRLGIKNFLKSLQPEMIHTTNRIYQEILLSQIGINARLLPLFGNVPIAVSNSERAWRILEDSGAPSDSKNDERWWRVVFFGSLHPEWSPEPLFSMIRQAAKSCGRRVLFVSIGRMGRGKLLWKEMILRYGAEFCFSEVGERSVEEISELFSEMNFGVSLTPYQNIGKSGSVAAMCEHGLPVIVTREERYGLSSDEILSENPLIVRMDASLVSRLENGLARGVRKSRKRAVAVQFLADLQAEAK